MNAKNETIENHATGDKIEFLQTDEGSSGEMSKFIMTLASHSSWAKNPRHYHPFQTETFKVISGVLNLTVGDQTLVLTPEDEKVIVKKFQLHSFWNSTTEEVKFIAEIFPPINIEKGLRLTYKLSGEGKINKRNIPYNPFYTLILMDYFDSYFNHIPWRLQKFLFHQGANVARFFGYK